MTKLEDVARAISRAEGFQPDMNPVKTHNHDPEAAHFVGRTPAWWMVYEETARAAITAYDTEPSAEEIEAAAATYSHTEGNLKTAIRAALLAARRIRLAQLEAAPKPAAKEE